MIIFLCLLSLLPYLAISAPFELVKNDTAYAYNTNSTNTNRALLALSSNAYDATYGSLALNESLPNIVYYSVGLDAGVLQLRLNAFMERKSDNGRSRVYINSTVFPTELIEVDASGELTDNVVKFANTSTGWQPIGTGILNLSAFNGSSVAKMLPDDSLLERNATIITATWTGPQCNSQDQNITAAFAIFIAPGIKPFGRMLMVDGLKNVTGLIAAVSVANFPFRGNGSSLVLRSALHVNETVFTVDQTVSAPPLNETVPFMAFPNGALVNDVVVKNRQILNLRNNSSLTQQDSVALVAGNTDNSTGNIVIVEGIAVRLNLVEQVVPSEGYSHNVYCLFTVIPILFVTIYHCM